MAAASVSLLFLVPSHNSADTRYLPITLGRKSLVTWWWIACPCMGVTTRTPCSECTFLGTQALALSKIMFHINSRGILTLDQKCTNRTLVRVNGIGVLGKKQHQLWEGDVITIGQYASVAWMTLYVKAKRVVTPEANRRLSSAERSVIDTNSDTSNVTGTVRSRMRDVTHGYRDRIVRIGTAAESSSRASESCRVNDENNNNVRRSRSWLKTPSRMKRCLPKTCPLSPEDLFDSLESDDCRHARLKKRRTCSKTSIPDVIEKGKITQTLPKMSNFISDQGIVNSDGDLTNGKKKPTSCLVPYMSLQRTHVWDGDESITDPDNDDSSKLPNRMQDEEDESIQSIVPAMGLANSTAVSRVGFETQAADRHTMGSLPSSPVEDTVLSLPQCPTYDGDSSGTMDGNSPYRVKGHRLADGMFCYDESDSISEAC